METFLEFLREILKGILREVSGFLIRKNKKTRKPPRAVQSKRVILIKNIKV